MGVRQAGTNTNPCRAALSWAKPKEAWDTRSGIIRPITWFAVLYAPIGYALFTFNLLGDAVNDAFNPRAR